MTKKKNTIQVKKSTIFRVINKKKEQVFSLDASANGVPLRCQSSSKRIRFRDGKVVVPAAPRFPPRRNPRRRRSAGGSAARTPRTRGAGPPPALRWAQKERCLAGGSAAAEV